MIETGPSEGLSRILGLGGSKSMIQKKQALILIGTISLLFIAFGGVSYTLMARMLEGQFVKAVEWFAHNFADEVSLYLRHAEKFTSLKQELDALGNNKIREYWIYTQVVQDGKVLMQVRSPQASNAALQAEALPAGSGFVVIKRRLPDGTPYLDMLLPLEFGKAQASQAYIRLGISLEGVASATRIGALLLALVGLICLTISILVIVHLTGRGEQSDQLSTQKVPLPSPADALIYPPEVKTQHAPVALSPENSRALIQVGELRIENGSKEVSNRGQIVRLSPKEYELLKLLASEPGRVFSDEEIVQRIWPDSSSATADDVRKYIRFLRQKLEENPENPQLIMTIRGFGYKLAS